MPFKIVCTSRRGRKELCTVPSQWEYNGWLRWPKVRNADRLAKDDSIEVGADWTPLKCEVKRSNFFTYEDAEYELSMMLNTSETETDNENFAPPPSSQNSKQYKAVDFNACAKNLLIGSTGNISVINPHAKINQGGSPNIHNRQTFVRQETITSSSLPVQVESTRNILANINPHESNHGFIDCSDICNYQTQTHGREEVDTTPTAPPDPPVQNQLHATLHTPPMQAEETPHIVGSTIEMIDTTDILKQISTILSNQDKIMRKLAELSVQLEESRKVNVTTLSEAKGAQTEKMVIKPITKIEELEELDLKLSNSENMKSFIETYSMLCSKADGCGATSAYRLLDIIFSKDFMCTCSWTGCSRGNDAKFAFKRYKNVIKVFYEMVHFWDQKYTIEDNETFFKNVLRNSLKRKEMKDMRRSAKKTYRGKKIKTVHTNEMNNKNEENKNNNKKVSLVNASVEEEKVSSDINLEDNNKKVSLVDVPVEEEKVSSDINLEDTTKKFL